MSCITIKVEFLAGTGVKAAIKEAIGLARRMDIAYVSFDFNGVLFSIGQNCDVDLACADYSDGKKHVCHA